MRGIHIAVLSIVVEGGYGLEFKQQIASWLVGHQSAKIEAPKNLKHGFDQKSFNAIDDLSSVNIAKGALAAKHFIGVVAIPDINLSVPISDGVSNIKLAQGAVTLKSGQKMGDGNYALAGHNMHRGSTILFGPLYTSAKVGQKIYLSDLKHVYVYKTAVVKQIAATDVGVIKDVPGQKLVTLVTCNNDGSARIEVRGTYVKQMPIKKADKALRDVLTKNVKAE